MVETDNIISAPVDMVFAVAAAVRLEDSKAADDILAGQALIERGDAFSPPPEAMSTELERYLPARSFGPRSREVVQAVTIALYAKLSAGADDATQTLNTPRYKSAVEAITGGIVTLRGNNLVSPWHGAGQRDFVDALQSVTDEDMKGSRTSDWTPLPADAVKPEFSDAWRHFKLENHAIGDGKYRIYKGPDNAKAYLKDQNGRPFLLDLGAKKEAIFAARDARYQAMRQAFCEGAE